MKRKRKAPAERKRMLLNAGMKLAKKYGYNHVTREMVANETGVCPSLVSRYFHSMIQFKYAIMSEAVENNHLEIIAQGVSLHHPLTRKINSATKRKIKMLFD